MYEIIMKKKKKKKIIAMKTKVIFTLRDQDMQLE